MKKLSFHPTGWDMRDYFPVPPVPVVSTESDEE